MTDAPFLQHVFPEPELNLSLEVFLRMACQCLGERLQSVILHGSLLFNDLAPGYGDLDFVAIIDGDLSQHDIERLVEIRRPLRDGRFGIYAHMIEGPFLPRHMLDPHVPGSAFCWGTSREYAWNTNRLGALVLRLIKQRGLVVFGEDIRPIIPPLPDSELLKEIADLPQSMREHGKPGELHSVDWLLTTARMLLWLKEGRFSSKTEAADWAYAQDPSGWRAFLPRAKEIRRNPSTVSSPAMLAWLQSLGSPIQEAAGELDNEIAKQMPLCPEWTIST